MQSHCSFPNGLTFKTQLKYLTPFFSHPLPDSRGISDFMSTSILVPLTCFAACSHPDFTQHGVSFCSPDSRGAGGSPAPGALAWGCCWDCSKGPGVQSHPGFPQQHGCFGGQFLTTSCCSSNCVRQKPQRTDRGPRPSAGQSLLLKNF